MNAFYIRASNFLSKFYQYYIIFVARLKFIVIYMEIFIMLHASFTLKIIIFSNDQGIFTDNK